jgi:hypothetical protein
MYQKKEAQGHFEILQAHFGRNSQYGVDYPVPAAEKVVEGQCRALL